MLLPIQTVSSRRTYEMNACCMCGVSNVWLRVTASTATAQKTKEIGKRKLSHLGG